METRVKDNEQVTEFKGQIGELQLVLGRVKTNGDELKEMHTVMDSKQEAESKQLGEVEKTANSREFIDEKLLDLSRQLAVIQRNGEDLKVQQSVYNKQVVQMDTDYAQRVRSSQEQFVRRLDDLISKNELIVELQDVKRQFSSVLQLQEQMKFNLTHINVKGKEHEKEQQRQFTRIADLTSKTTQNDLVVKQEINKELSQIKTALDDIVKKQEVQKGKVEKSEQKQEELDKVVKQKHSD